MISSKYLKVIIGILLSIAVIFTSVIMFMPKDTTTNTTVSKEYETKVFNKDKITSINIIMDENNWNDMIKNATKEEYYKCDVTINGTTFKNVGIRPKGNTSLSQVASNPDSDRYSFKIEFDHYVDGQTCFGLDKLIINNMISDTTYMKEYLSYDLLEYIGVKTPLYSYSDVSLNGEKWGLYLALEGMEESFAERTFGSDYGMLYKPESMNMGGGKALGAGGKPQGGMGEPPNGMKPPEGMEMPENMTPPENNQNKSESKSTSGNTNTDRSDKSNTENTQGKMPGGMGPGGMEGSGGGCDLVYTDDNISSYSNIFDSAVFESTNSDYKRIISALKGLSTGENLEKYVNVDDTLRYFAANTMLVNLDSYVSNLKHNYYLYEKDGQISILPWDFNLSFAGFQSNNSTSAVNFPIDTPVTGVSLSDRPLIGKLLENDEYKNTYHKYLQELVNGYFNSGKFETTVTKLDNLIKDYVKNDPTAFYTYEEYEKSIPVLKEFGSLRSKSVDGQLNGTVPSTTETQQSQKDKLIDASSINLSTLGSQGGGKGPNEVNKTTQQNNNENTQTNSSTNKNIEESNVSVNASEKTTDTSKNNNTENKEMQQKRPSNFNRGSQGIDKSTIIVTLGSVVVLGIAFVFVIKFKRKK